jgi:hypothetical protein
VIVAIDDLDALPPLDLDCDDFVREASGFPGGVGELLAAQRPAPARDAGLAAQSR